jgi:hypothetical protein
LRVSLGLLDRVYMNALFAREAKRFPLCVEDLTLMVGAGV